ncbi:hypothetical protein HKD37_14G040832 [Glycine soja]
MDEEQWMYDNIMSEKVYMNVENEEDAGMKIEHVDCSNAFNTSRTFFELCYSCLLAVMKFHIGLDRWLMALDLLSSDTNTGVRGRASFLLIACERSSEYRPKKNDLVRTCTNSRKYGCPFKLRAKPVLGGEEWMVKLICGVYNHEMAKSLVRHPYAGRQTKDEKIVVANMTKSMRFQSLFMRVDALPWVIVIDKDLSLMDAVKIVFPDAMNLLCRFHIDKNVKAKCKTLVAQKNAWDYVMEAWGSLVDCPCESSFDEYLKKFEMACSLWPMFVDYVCQTWVIMHKEKFVKAWTNKVMHLGNITTNRVESAHWSLKRLLQNSLGDICSVWEAMNNMMTLQHTQIKASFETSTHMVGHVFKVTLYKKVLGMVSRYALNEIVAKYKRVPYAGKNPSHYGCVTRSTHGLPCACELSKYVIGSIPLETIHIFWWKLIFSNQGKGEDQGCSKKIIDQTTKVNNVIRLIGSMLMRYTLCKIRRNIPMLDQFHLCIQDSIENIINVKADGNCGYRAIAILLGMGEESWSLVCNHLHKELTSWLEEYINLLGGIERFKELKRSLLVDELSMVTMDKWMNITDMRYVIASRYNVLKLTATNYSMHRVICIGHVYGNHFVHVSLRDHCPLPLLASFWNTHYHYQAKQWPTLYIGRMQRYTNLFRLKT